MFGIAEGVLFIYNIARFVFHVYQLGFVSILAAMSFITHHYNVMALTQYRMRNFITQQRELLHSSKNNAARLARSQDLAQLIAITSLHRCLLQRIRSHFERVK